MLRFLNSATGPETGAGSKGGSDEEDGQEAYPPPRNLECPDGSTPSRWGGYGKDRVRHRMRHELPQVHHYNLLAPGDPLTP
jgi:hypothetical protein